MGESECLAGEGLETAGGGTNCGDGGFVASQPARSISVSVTSALPVESQVMEES